MVFIEDNWKLDGTKNAVEYIISDTCIVMGHFSNLDAVAEALSLAIIDIVHMHYMIFLQQCWPG